jgi:hypothetical protein
VLRTAVVAVVLAVLTLAATEPSHATLNACAAGKKKCVNKKAAAILKCHTKAETPPNGLSAGDLATCIQKAKAKFDGGGNPSKGCFAKLEAKFPGGCLRRVTRWHLKQRSMPSWMTWCANSTPVPGRVPFRLRRRTPALRRSGRRAASAVNAARSPARSACVRGLARTASRTATRPTSTVAAARARHAVQVSAATLVRIARAAYARAGRAKCRPVLMVS